MKRICSLLMSLVLTFALGSTCFAAESLVSSDENEKIVTEEISTRAVEPREVELLYSQDLYFWPGYEGSFHLNATRNLKIVFGATADCNIMVYKGNSIIPIKSINLIGDGTSRTYDIKNNCSAGDYRFILPTNDQNCFASMGIVATQST